MGSSQVGAMMVNCSDFLRDYSDFRDGLIDTAGHAAMEAHIAACSRCQRYDRVLAAGIGELRSMPQVSPSYDFLPRLQHRLYHLEEETSWRSRADTSATSPVFVLLLASLIGAAAWLPIATSESTPTVQLEPVVASAPLTSDVVHTLFRAGPLLTREQEPSLSADGMNTVFFRYTPLGSRASYQTVTLRPR
ncbi:MAG: zf-HC2 domain-containing protein [Gemmatimonadota bacterium]